MFSWGTQYIPTTARAYEHPYKYRATLRSWQKLFGESTNAKMAISVIRDTFVRTKQDRVLMDRALKLRRLAKDRNVPCISKKRRAPAGEKPAWDNKEYNCLFGRLDPHEAILLAFLSWDTICPHQEFLTPNTHRLRGKIRKSMQSRLGAWDSLFGRDADPWSVVYTLRSMCKRNDQPVEFRLIKRAVAICRKMEDH